MNVSQMHIHGVHELDVSDPEFYDEKDHDRGTYTRIEVKGPRGELTTIFIHFDSED